MSYSTKTSRHTKSVQRRSDVGQCRATSHRLWNDAMCLHGNSSQSNTSFRANFSTGLSLAQQTNLSLTDMDKGMHTGTILIDLKTDKQQDKLMMYFNLLDITSCCGNREMVSLILKKTIKKARQKWLRGRLWPFLSV